jgi:hypothetical protein
MLGFVVPFASLSSSTLCEKCWAKKKFAGSNRYVLIFLRSKVYWTTHQWSCFKIISGPTTIKNKTSFLLLNIALKLLQNLVIVLQ